MGTHIENGIFSIPNCHTVTAVWLLMLQNANLDTKWTQVRG